MLAIKFQRVGKKHQPSYRVVVAEKRSKLGGPPVEQVGFYNPTTKAASFEKERVLYWLKIGAKPTTSVHNLLVKQGVISGRKIAVKMAKPEAVPDAATAVSAAVAGASQAESAAADGAVSAEASAQEESLTSVK